MRHSETISSLRGKSGIYARINRVMNIICSDIHSHRRLPVDVFGLCTKKKFFSHRENVWICEEYIFEIIVNVPSRITRIITCVNARLELKFHGRTKNGLRGSRLQEDRRRIIICPVLLKKKKKRKGSHTRCNTVLMKGMYVLSIPGISVFCLPCM